MSVNKAIIIGRLGADPEVRFTQGGQAVANFNVATDEVWTDKSGQRQERVEWHRIVVWGRQAELCGEYLRKGRETYIEGRIETREWQDRDGNRRWTTEIKAQNIRFLGGRDTQGGSQGSYDGGGPGGGGGAPSGGGGAPSGGGGGGPGFNDGPAPAAPAHDGPAPAGPAHDGPAHDGPAHDGPAPAHQAPQTKPQDNTQSGPPGGFDDDEIPF